MADFDIALALVLKHEGTYTPGLPSDTGGETYRGVARNANPNWPGWTLIDVCKGKPGFPGVLDADQSLQDAVRTLYRRDYWLPLLDHVTNQRVANAVLDFAVNAGQREAIEALQKSVGVPVDGVLGPGTLTAVNNAGVPGAQFFEERMRFYTSLAAFRLFAKSWTVRALDY